MDAPIRPETARDRAAIRAVTRRAFAGMPHSRGDEQDLIDRLRAAGALALSLVAEREGRVIGHVAFSPAVAADGSPGWYALGPVAVEPGLQRRGIGASLIETGIGALRGRGAAGCVLVGDPGYYGRFGFRLRPELAPEDVPAEYFMILPLAVAEPKATVRFHPLLAG